MRARLFVVPMSVAVLLFAGCSSERDPGGAPPPVADEEIAPKSTATTPAGSVVYSPNVFVLDAATTNLAQVGSDRLTFPATGTRGVASRRAGDVLVSSKDGRTAFLRRVVSVQRSTAGLIVMTTNATLTDAVKEANLHVSIPVAPASARAPFDGPSGGLFGGKIDFAFAQSWDCGFLNCQESAGMKITPKILGGYFTPDVRIDAEINIFDNKPVLLKFVTTSTLDADLTLGLKIENKGSFRLEGTLFESPEIPIPIGDIPTFVKGAIVGGSEGEFYAPAVDLRLEGGFHAGLTAGFQIENDGTPQGIFTGGDFTPTFDASIVGVGAEVRARRYLALKVSWMVGIPGGVLEAGPQLAIRKYWQTRWYADSQNGVFQEDDTGHDVTVVGAVKELGLTQSLSLKLADFTDSSQKVSYTGPFAVFPCATAKDGDYCGGETLDGFRLGVSGHLYDCAHGDVASDATCAYGCGPATGVDKAQGKRVACNPSPTNPCHAAADGNYCGNETRDGFTGGSLGLSASTQVTCAGGNVSHEQTCSHGCGPVGGGVGCLTPNVGPSAPCGAGDQAGPNNGTCGPDGRVYYCYQNVWRVKDDCVAKNERCVVEPAGVADVCQASSGRLSPPSAPCGAGDQAGPNNGTCGPDGRVYYCYQGVWNLKDDCAARSVACIVEPAGVADHCTSGCGDSSACGRGESCSGGACVCPGPVCGASCCGAGEWCGTGNRCCSGCAPGCPC